MSSSIYTKLAWTNLKNNHKTYVPYLLTSILTVMMFYIMDALSQSDDIKSVTLRMLLDYALGVILIFSVIFLFYTNSFLIKRRKKEIGVYNILGMGKRHIAKMLMVETLIMMSASLVFGLIAGMVFGKLMYLILLKLLRYDIGMNFGISVIGIQQTILLYVLIYGVILIYNLIQIRLSNPIDLLHAMNQGEKEPKTKWFLALVGILAIATGYGIAIVVEQPLEALGGFFIAVVCVMIGTYALFTAGSIALLKMLKRNKTYYYKTNHFTAVSGMIYRMKQNAAGLANICILSTMVLVMVSTTFSLYMGMEDILEDRFPQECSITTAFESDEKAEQIKQLVSEELMEEGLLIEEPLSYNSVSVAACQENDRFYIPEHVDYTASNIKDLTWIALEDYNQLEENAKTLAENEVLLYTSGEAYSGNTIEIEGKVFRIKEVLPDLELSHRNHHSMVDMHYIIFSSRAQIQEMLRLYNEKSKVHQTYTSKYAFDIIERNGKESNDTQVKEKNAMEAIQTRIREQEPDAYIESRSLAEKSFYEIYGSLLFIGMYLGVMFLMATVLIIYYKQISEGYDDRERYQIMQKVGMSRMEVKRSIRSQVLIVFFLPLMTAILHNIVAFQIVNKLLETLNFVNAPLYLWCTAVSICVFAIFYAIVYVITAREYYKIVN